MTVPVKKTRKPAAPVKYLLSGDRKLQRLSLKKIADPARKAKPRTRSARAKQGTDEDAAAATSPKRIGGRLAVGGVVFLFAAAALLAARQPVASPDHVSAGAAMDAATSSQQPAPTADRASNTNATAAPLPSSTPAVARPHATPAAIEKSAAPGQVKKTQTARAVASSTAAPESTAPVKNTPPLTVEGCLESDGSTYRLKDTSGLDAPKVRSWRTGFLMKRSSSIGLVDTTGRLRLQDRIGTRVAATGSLEDRELRATALRQVAASCR
jgi:hypothetical protein